LGGSRRISLLIAGVTIAVTLYIAYEYEPYVSVTYSISHPNSTFVKMENECPSDAANHYFTTKLQSDKSVAINLCLLAMSFGKDSERLIPYKVDDKGLIWGDKSFGDNVALYEKTLEGRFIASLDEKVLEGEVSKKYRESFIETIKYLFYGLVIFWGGVSAVGWIVRGFLGIPTGLDIRPSKE
jgi:hypothetical protein